MYDFKKIEKKWQKYWEENEVFNVTEDKDNKYYILVEFPYPSGTGLHTGHVRSYTALDAVARMRRMKGYNVLFPMGWDAFGAPAEQYAIKNHIHPKDAVKENIKTYKSQIKELGISFDWKREINTSDPNYYKWTQWQFLKFYEHDMAYKAKVPVNWCPKCKTVLSNEDSAGGVCERCQTVVVQKEKSQWMLRMSDYAEDLLQGLNDTKFADRVKLGQINWIGKSEGIEVDIDIVGGGSFKIFTTCIETIYGITFFVIAPDGKLINELMPKVQNKEEINEYINETKTKTNLDRTELNKGKTGVEVKGVKAINPVNGKEVPIFLGDFVLGDYGTGAVMAVPSHDQRDFEYAKHHNLEMIKVIEGQDTREKAFEKQNYLGKECKLINSEEFNGLTVEEAKEKITDKLVKMKIARKVANYKMRDWIFSRQRFWGEPIPLIHCDECGWVPVPEKDLPVELPEIAQYDQSDDGESPLSTIDSWVNTTCPKCGKMAKRETDTMPNWAGSSWYWLRYMDPTNQKEFASKEKLEYWGKVDWYNGGMEHTARHLLYARFWNQFLYNINLVPNKEPFDVRVSHGMILGSNGEKMSKSKGNTVDPHNLVEEVGSDALRIYEMFIGDYEKDASWSINGLKGCKKFLDKLWNIQNKLSEETGYTNEILVHQTIKKVTHDLDNMKYNTVVSALMILLNAYEKQEKITKDDLRILIHLLNPIAPHITEEINQNKKLGNVLCLSKWPEYDETKTIAQNVTIAVSINGKLRGTFETAVDTNKEMLIEKAKENENVKRYLTDKEIKKEIVVPNKVVNLIIK